MNIDEPLARIKTDGTIRYYQQDALGSVIALTDETGTIKTQYIYDPYGNVTTSGEASDNPFQYTGRENDGTGLYYYRARYYSPELQRFISEDPIGFYGGDVNLYSYVWNDPQNWIDPFGLQITRGISKGILSGGTGSMIGGIVGGVIGAAVGARVGGPVGGVIGGVIGGYVGGKIGGQFDPPCSGQLNCEDPMPPEPPKPSECHGTDRK